MLSKNTKKNFLHANKYQPLELICEDDEENGRHYITPEGNRYPSVTNLLGQNPEKNKSLEKWRERIGEEEAEKISYWSRTRGDALHKLNEQFLRNEEIDIMAQFRQDPIVLDFFKQFKRLLVEHIDVVHMIECPLYSDEYCMAGRADLIAEVAGKLTIIDFKTSLRKKRHEWIEDYFIQSTCYSKMFEERYGDSIEQIGIFIARKDLDVPQVFLEAPDSWHDHDFFVNRINSL